MVLKLAPKPTALAETKESVVKLLRDSLALAEKGEVDTVLVIMSRVDGEWTNAFSETLKLSETIGRLEITKLEFINRFFEQEKSK